MKICIWAGPLRQGRQVIAPVGIDFHAAGWRPINRLRLIPQTVEKRLVDMNAFLSKNRARALVGAAVAGWIIWGSAHVGRSYGAEVGPRPATTNGLFMLLRPARVFTSEDGQSHDGWVVTVASNRIVAVGPAEQVQSPAPATNVDLPGMTLLP
jgi:hypothetical protein